MRGSSKGATMFAVIALLALTVALGVHPWDVGSAGSAKLISVEQFPEGGEICLPESANDSFNPTGELREGNLFGALGEGTVYAAAQGQGGGPEKIIPAVVEVRAAQEISRPPLRYVRDLDPTYSYVAVDL